MSTTPNTDSSDDTLLYSPNFHIQGGGAGGRGGAGGKQQSAVQKIKEFMGYLGPGWMIAIGYLDPGKIVISSIVIVITGRIAECRRRWKRSLNAGDGGVG